MTVTKLKESHHFAPKSNARRSVNTLHNDPAFLQRFWNHPAPSFPQSVPYFDREKLFLPLGPPPIPPLDFDEKKQEYSIHFPQHIQQCHQRISPNLNNVSINEANQKPPNERHPNAPVIADSKRKLSNVTAIHELSDKSHRLTPEIVEPRISALESDAILRKKVKPVCQNGTSLLPSIDSFRKSINNNIKNIKLNPTVTVGNTDEELCTTDSDASPIKSPYKNESDQNLPGAKQKSRKGAKKMLKVEKLSCGCSVDLDQKSPFYTHLGTAPSLEELHAKLAARYDVSMEAMRIHVVKSTQTEGKNGDGCPLARWVLRRTGPDEKYLIVAKRHEEHTCQHKVAVVIIVAWEGISEKYADQMYEYLTENLNDSGFSTRRRCGTNESKTCMCQGKDDEKNGASFTFGCSWSMFFDGCKFAKSLSPRKFRMQDSSKEKYMEDVLQDMTTKVSPLLKVLAPEAFDNMTRNESVASDCRIGKNTGRPFSGVTCCLDFCAHSHKDQHNMHNGTTMVCTLLKPDYDRNNDEQLHVLPLYQLCDRQGNVLPPNFTIPQHFLHSSLQLKKEPAEGKGRYVCPEAVGTVNKKPKLEEDLPAEKASTFVDDQNISNFLFKGLDVTKIPPLGVPEAQAQQQQQQQLGQQQQLHFVEQETLSLFRSDDNRAPENSESTTEPISQPTVITPEMGGVAVALGHGSFLIECAKKELHATTALKNPSRNRPTRLSMVFYQHKKLNKGKHGYMEYQEKDKQRKIRQQSFDDLQLLADTAQKSNEKETKSISLNNTPVKRNPLLELCRVEFSEQKSSSEPNLPSLFIPNLKRPSENCEGKTSTSHPHYEVSNRNSTKSSPPKKGLTSFSVESIMEIPGKETSQQHQPHQAVVCCQSTTHQEQLPSASVNVNKLSLPTFSIFQKPFRDNIDTKSTEVQETNRLVEDRTSIIDKTKLQNASSKAEREERSVIMANSQHDHQISHNDNKYSRITSDVTPTKLDNTGLPDRNNTNCIQTSTLCNSNTPKNISRLSASSGNNQTQEEAHQPVSASSHTISMMKQQQRLDFIPSIPFQHETSSSGQSINSGINKSPANIDAPHQIPAHSFPTRKPHTLLDQHNEILKHFPVPLPSPILSPVSSLPEDLLKLYRQMYGESVIPSPIHEKIDFDEKSPVAGIPFGNPARPTGYQYQNRLLDRHANMFVNNSWMQRNDRREEERTSLIRGMNTPNMQHTVIDRKNGPSHPSTLINGPPHPSTFLDRPPHLSGLVNGPPHPSTLMRMRMTDHSHHS